MRRPARDGKLIKQLEQLDPRQPQRWHGTDLLPKAFAD